MAIYKNSYPFGSIVYSGLALNLDLTDVRSYPGSGTTWNSTVATYSFSGSITGTPQIQRGRTLLSLQSASYGSNFTNTGCDNTTMELWFRFDTTAQARVISYLGSSGGTGMGMYLYDGITGGTPGNKVGVLYGGSFYNALNVGTTYATLTSGSWTCLTMTRDTTTTTLYQNGISVGSTTRTPNSNTTLLTQEPSSNASGSISIFRMYKKCLTQQEVLQNYNALKSRFGL